MRRVMRVGDFDRGHGEAAPLQFKRLLAGSGADLENTRARR